MDRRPSTTRAAARVPLLPGHASRLLRQRGRGAAATTCAVTSAKAERQAGHLVNVGQAVGWLTGAVALILLIGSAALVGFVGHLKTQIGPPPLAAAADFSTTVLDRNGQLLRAFTARDGRWRLPVDVDDVDPRYFQLLLNYEDRRFHHHGGVDPWAVARAAVQLVWHGRAVSGASTLTMQTARLLDRRHERTPLGKLRQMARALQLETRLSKREILATYLRLAPFGGNVEGVRAATLAYFGKEPKRLSLAEAALLVALPQSPEARRPDRHHAAAKAARDRVLARALSGGVITAATARRAQLEPVPRRRRAFPLHAAHLADAERRDYPDRAIHRLTVDRNLQATLTTLARTQAQSLGPDLSAAILAVDAHTGEVLAHVGSPDYLDRRRHGAIDMTQAIRSPGSTLKPFIYGLAFEAGIAHPETLIVDKRTRFGSYTPDNFNGGYHGTVTLRQALGLSLNIPAVKLLDRVSPPALMSRLARAGIRPQLPDHTRPSLAVALGGVGLTLKDLTYLYAALARGGTPQTIIHRLAEHAPTSQLGDGHQTSSRPPLLDPVAAWYVSDILKEAPAPKPFRKGRIAYKTGTSYGYRDAYAIGFDGRTVIAVWVGRADGLSVPGLVGRTAAAPILFDAFQRLGRPLHPLPRPPAGALRVSGADLPAPLKRFDAGRAKVSNGPFLQTDVAIAFPPDRSEIEVGQPGSAAALQPIRLKAEGGALPLTWLVDGNPISSSRHRRDAIWQPLSQGFAKVSVIDAEGRVDRVVVRVR